MDTSRSTLTPVKISATNLRRRWLAMWLLCGASLMIILDGMKRQSALASSGPGNDVGGEASGWPS